MTLKWLPPTAVVHKTCSFPNFQTRREYTSFAFDLYVYTRSVTYFLPLYRPFFFLLSVFFAVFILSRKHPFFGTAATFYFCCNSLYTVLSSLTISFLGRTFSVSFRYTGTVQGRTGSRFSLESLLIRQCKFQLFS